MTETEQFAELFAKTLNRLGFDLRFLESYREQKMEIRKLKAENERLTNEVIILRRNLELADDLLNARRIR